MRTPITLTLTLTLTGLFSGGCRMDPGEPDYSGHVGLVKDKGGPADENLPGPDPYVPGEDRLMLGLFYEGGASERVLLNGQTTHYYIFVIQGSNALTYTQETDGDRVEGRLSDRIILNGTPWWGGGIVWDNPTDLSAWTQLHVSLKSSDPSFADFAITMGSGMQYKVQASAYGYTNDGEWHSLVIPLQDFVAQGLNKATIKEPFILGADGGNSGDVLLVDDVFLTQE